MSMRASASSCSAPEPAKICTSPIEELTSPPSRQRSPTPCWHVTTTDGARLPPAPRIAAALPGLDVLFSGFQPVNGANDIIDTIQRSIADPTVYATAARALLKALESHPRTRLIVIGGAVTPEFKAEIVELCRRRDRSVGQVAKGGLKRSAH